MPLQVRGLITSLALSRFTFSHTGNQDYSPHAMSNIKAGCGPLLFTRSISHHLKFLDQCVEICVGSSLDAFLLSHAKIQSRTPGK